MFFFLPCKYWLKMNNMYLNIKISGSSAFKKAIQNLGRENWQNLSVRVLCYSSYCSDELHVWFSQFWSHFHGTMHCLPKRLKSTFFETLNSTFFVIFSNGAAPKGLAEWRKKFQKTLILVFEVIVQPPKTHFLTFSNVQKTHLWRKKWDQNHENHT